MLCWNHVEASSRLLAHELVARVHCGLGLDGMAAHVLISGTLFRSPEENFVAATIKVRDGEASQFWRVLAFSGTVQSELLRLEDGDARVGLTVIADAVLADEQDRARRAAKSRR